MLLFTLLFGVLAVMSFRWKLRAEEDLSGVMMLTANNHEQPKNFFIRLWPADLLACSLRARLRNKKRRHMDSRPSANILRLAGTI